MESRRPLSTLTSCQRITKALSSGGEECFAANDQMNKDNLNSEDAKLHALLRESRRSPSLPPRFQETVWRRIELADASKAPNELKRLEVLVNSLLRPKFAMATVATLVLLGTLLGVRAGTQAARNEAEARYMTKVARGVLE